MCFPFLLSTYSGFENDGQGFQMISGCRDCHFLLFFLFLNLCSITVLFSTQDLGL